MDKPAIVGGTFDPLHDGHKALFQKAFELADLVLIGLTSDSMASAYRTRRVTDFKSRKRRLSRYLYRTYPGKKFKIVRMDEIFNIPIIREITEGYLVISEGKYQVARNINVTRKHHGSKLFEIITVPYVLAADGMPIKATRVYKGEIDAHGKLKKPLVISVGSTNKLKIESVQFAFNQVCGECRVKGFKVNSGVKAQPIGKDTITGASNRARKAIEKTQKGRAASFGVGLEAGLFWVPAIKDYMDVQYCAIVDRLGNYTYGHSPGFCYPRDFHKPIRQGMEVEEIVAELYNIKNIGRKNGAIGYLTDDKITRKDLLVSAVMMALVPRIKQGLYNK
ncbi:MAG: inosine/xanthosine triphosphatase [Thermoplasmata archaeon]|nr:MAG: inosine/xanthosine triphosphatase [Thermoplasmata archaeon]